MRVLVLRNLAKLYATPDGTEVTLLQRCIKRHDNSEGLFCCTRQAMDKAVLMRGLLQAPCYLEQLLRPIDCLQPVCVYAFESGKSKRHQCHVHCAVSKTSGKCMCLDFLPQHVLCPAPMRYQELKMRNGISLPERTIISLGQNWCACRNSGQSRWPGFADHHFLHYLVTIACVLHVVYIRRQMEASGHHIAPVPGSI